ncbi:hypothetical protein H2248_000600 [Termitomyces sp. 'cryptogamus']|nr:hypothetical protein H2248_000600 [Termitomyces sp. 'cryptogamus']
MPDHHPNDPYNVESAKWVLKSTDTSASKSVTTTMSSASHPSLVPAATIAMPTDLCSGISQAPSACGEEMREQVGKDKFQWALKFAEEHKNSIKDFNFKPLDLVSVKNMLTESSLSAKMLPQFHGPMAVITKTRGGNYIVAGLDG